MKARLNGAKKQKFGRLKQDPPTPLRYPMWFRKGADCAP
jgi:hypothetical protein